MPKDELIAALERAAAKLPAAIGAAMCALFIFAGAKLLAGADTWGHALSYIGIIAGFACAFDCCIAALRATGRGGEQ